jgi:glutamate formiminotransferase
LLDCQSDYDHNRSVLTIAGTPKGIVESALSVSAKAVELIDMRNHKGVHPRIGAVDVVPFVPLDGANIEDCIKISNEFANNFAERFSIPVYLYGEAARTPERRNLPNIRNGQFEALRKLIGSDEVRKPDFGPNKIHPTAGATAVGARRILIAYNVNLGTNQIEVARRIARGIRETAGGLPAVQALGLKLESRGIVQVSTNLTDYRRTSLVDVYESIVKKAISLDVDVLDSEIVGMVPRDALPDSGLEELMLKDFSPRKIIENRVARLKYLGN